MYTCYSKVTAQGLSGIVDFLLDIDSRDKVSKSLVTKSVVLLVLMQCNQFYLLVWTCDLSGFKYKPIVGFIVFPPTPPSISVLSPSQWFVILNQLRTCTHLYQKSQ